MFVYIGKKSSVYGVFDSNLHTRLAIVTENELRLAFPPRYLPKKFRPDPSTFYLVIAFAGITRECRDAHEVSWDR